MAFKNINFFTFFACSKESNKEKAPFDRSRKTGSPYSSFFCGRRHKLIPICQDSNMCRLKSTKTPETAAWSKRGPDFPRSPLGTSL